MRSPSPTPPELWTQSFFDLQSELSEVPKQETEKRTWENLLDGSLCIGEKHGHIAPKKFLIQNMDLFRDAGFHVLFMEHLSVKEDLDLLREYFSTNGEMSVGLTKKLSGLDEGHKFPDDKAEEYLGEWDKYNFTQIVKAAKLSGIDVLPLEESRESWKSTKNGAKRAAILSLNAKKVIDQHAGSKWLALVGSAHLNTYHGIPGICEIVPDAQDLLITDAESSPLIAAGTIQQSLKVCLFPTNEEWATYDVGGSTTKACLKASMSLIRDFRSDMNYRAISDDKLRADAEVLPGLPSGAAGEKDHKSKRPRSEEGQESSAETAAVSRLSSTTPATMTMPKKTKDDQSQSRLKPPGAGGKSEEK